MMVEDEFCAVAQSFTQHLHYAEFVRLKKEAKLQNAATIADISRPTDGVTPMSEALKKRNAAEELKMKQKEGVDAALGKQDDQDDQEDPGEDMDDDAWAGTHLQNFILSPRRARSLVGLQGVRSSTRAAAGFAQSSSNPRKGIGSNGGLENLVAEEQKGSPGLDDTTDDDDLDAGAQQSPTAAKRIFKPVMSEPQRTSSPALPQSKPVRPSREHDVDVDVRQHTAALGRKIPASSSERLERSPSTTDFRIEKRPSDRMKQEQQVTETKDVSKNVPTKRRLAFDDFDELPEPRKPSIQIDRHPPLSTNSKRKKPNEKDTGSKKSRLHEVPTFLI